MSRLHEKRLLMGLLGVVGLLLFSTSADAFLLKANQVPDLTTQNVFTVAAGTAVLVNSMVIANPNASSTCCARLFRSGADVTGFIVVPAESSFQVQFNPAIRFEAGQVIQVRNGASSGPLNFTLNFNFAP
jgi:hypothetical protein